MTIDPTTFEYLKPTASQMDMMSFVRVNTANYARILDDSLPNGADKTYALRKLREVGMWANVAITRHADGAPRA